MGSTAMAGDQDPERVRVLLDRFYDAMAAEIERSGGTVEKFVGDAVMAAFGAPVAHEDDAERALHVALAMQRRLAGLVALGEPFALRELGIIRSDRALLAQAVARFEALGLGWHADETRRLAPAAS